MSVDWIKATGGQRLWLIQMYILKFVYVGWMNNNNSFLLVLNAYYVPGDMPNVLYVGSVLYVG